MAATVMRPASTAVSGGGTTGGKRYRIEKTLGEGTYGKVKLAFDNYTREKVAIKIIRKENVKTPKDMERVRREIDILSVLRHPHIIKVIDVVETRTNIIIVMEYAVNGELFDYINERRYLDEAESRKYFRQIISAVDYCHKNLVVHRDLKLENLLLDKDFNIKIIDFGLSNQFHNDALLNTFCGSPLYASPEMIQGKDYHGPEVDCWSLGVVLYTLLCGTMPFDDSDMKHLVDSITHASYPSPKGLTKLATDLLSRLLRANPKKRATIENIRVHPWTNDGYTRPPMQQPLSTVNHGNRRRLSNKISCLSETPIKGLTPNSRTKSDSKLSDHMGRISIKPKTPSSGRTERPSSGGGVSKTGLTNPNVKRKLMSEPASPKTGFREPLHSQPIKEAERETERELERPKSAAAMLSKSQMPAKPPRPSRSKLGKCDMVADMGGDDTDGATSPEDPKQLGSKRSSSYNRDSDTSEPHYLTPDRRTLSENINLAKYGSDYDAAPDFKPPQISGEGEITMVDSESHLFDGFGGSMRSIQHVQLNMDNHIEELSNMLLKAKEDEDTDTAGETTQSITPVPKNRNELEVQPEHDNVFDNDAPKPVKKESTVPKPPLEREKSLTRTPLKGPGSTARSKAAINKTALGAKRPRPVSNNPAQRAKSIAARDRPSSTRAKPSTAPAKPSSAGTVAARNRRNSDVCSTSSVRSLVSEPKSTTPRGSLRGTSTTSPAKRNTKIVAKSKVDCHRVPTAPPRTAKDKSSDHIIPPKTNDKTTVSSKISSYITGGKPRPKTSAQTNENKTPESKSPTSTPTTPRGTSKPTKTVQQAKEDSKSSLLPRYKGQTPVKGKSNTTPATKESKPTTPFR